MVSCLAAAALFGAFTPASKALLESTGPFTLAGLLYLGGALGTLPWCFRGGSAELRRDPRQLSALLRVALDARRAMTALLHAARILGPDLGR